MYIYNIICKYHIPISVQESSPTFFQTLSHRYHWDHWIAARHVRLAVVRDSVSAKGHKADPLQTLMSPAQRAAHG
jgi:hypothetical protein